MEYENWVKKLPPEITEDTVWNLKVYRVALYLSELCWSDSQLIADKRHFSLSDQLYKSTGSVSANITEGYSRNSNKEKARFYEIALGSARESKDWYFKSRYILGEIRSLDRMRLLTSIIRLLLTMINEKRNSFRISESKAEYKIDEFEENLTNPDDID